jgi:hypothetical protein
MSSTLPYSQNIEKFTEGLNLIDFCRQCEGNAACLVSVVDVSAGLGR